MPCNTVTTQSVALANAMPEIVAHALKSLGWIIRESTTTRITAYHVGTANDIIWTPGKGITIQGYGNTQEQIKTLTKEYSKQAVTWAAKRAGWTVQQTAQDRLTVSRR